MEHHSVIVIGGGATGVGILRDLSMRGIDTLLIEKADLMNGASSRYHGLLHSGGRYAVKDAEAAHECIVENEILRRIGASCVEVTEGLFVRMDVDDEAYEALWVEGCKKSGIRAEKIPLSRAFELVPRLSRRAQSAYLVPDAAIDGFRMAEQNVASAKRYGGAVRNYTELLEIHAENGAVRGISVRDTLTGAVSKCSCDFLINAGGGWVDQIARLAGLDVRVQPDKGTLIAFHSRLTNLVVNRLHKSSDGDIFVPHGSSTILGTTSISIDDPEITSTSREEVERLLSIGEVTFENLRDYRILRVFAGSRPLYIPPGGELGRGASRGFAIIDHEAQDGLKGMFTIVGGKFTTYRLMAEKMADRIAEKMGNHAPCRTAEEPLVDAIPREEAERAKRFFPSFGTHLAAERLGTERFRRVVRQMEEDAEKRLLVCECENVTLAEVEEVAREGSIRAIHDLRRRTRAGMGTCQANYCAMRSAAAFARVSASPEAKAPVLQMKSLFQERWKGMRPVLFGQTLKAVELSRAQQELTLGVRGGEFLC